MCTENFIWYQEPAIWAAVIAGAFAIISGVGSWLFYRRNNKILFNFQKSLNEHQEKIRVEYSLIYSKRLQIIEELHSHLLLLDDYYNKLQKYKLKAKENIDYKINDEDSEKLKKDYFIIANYLDTLNKYKLYFPRKFANHITYNIKLLTQRILLIVIDELIENGVIFSETDRSKFEKLESDFAYSKESIENIYTLDFDEAVSELLGDLEDEFRKLIGII